jgi:hypothetical protein
LGFGIWACFVAIGFILFEFWTLTFWPVKPTSQDVIPAKAEILMAPFILR